MIRHFLPAFFLVFAVLFNAQAQKSSDEKATSQASIITQYINAKAAATGAAQLSDEQTEAVKQAYIQYYDDRAAWKKRKKEFYAVYKEWKAAASQTVTPEKKAELEAQKKEIAKENAYINKEVKDIPVRRDDAIKAALDEGQKAIFVEMREEQSKKDDDDADKK